ncbi:MAG: cation:proton antiporter [Bacteroidaceae bacterium]|nr:cation:proton antiporter [Bacteroidaceae bacterium]
MTEELHLVSDLALILISAGIFTIISKALKQPLILGYIVAGFLVGPHLGLFPSVTDTHSVEQWSEIGIIFLLFSLGLEFSFKKLIKVGSSALIMAVTKCIGMFIVGIILGSVLHWTLMESVFLGGLLSMSSTTIIIKAYDDMKLKNKPYASLVFGSLVFEDLIAILLLVLLSTLAVSNKFAGGEMIGSLLKLGFFMVLWFVVGIFMIPTLLKRAQKYINDEILLIVSIGLCFGMVALAEYVGFSSALGAFVMGSILAETLEGEHIMHLTDSIKDLFGAIFFVSVGMMVDPQVIAEHWLTILVLTVVAMMGILFFSTAGSVLSGQNLENSVHAGFSLAQLGEFAFIIASLGCSLGVMRDFIYPVVVAVSVITTFTTPYMINAAGPAYRLLLRKLPEEWLNRINAFSSSDKSNTAAAKNEWKRVIRIWLLRVVLYGVVLLALFMGAHLYLDKVLGIFSDNWSEPLIGIVKTVITLVVMSPFLGGMAISGNDVSKSLRKLIKEKKSNVWPALSLLLIRILLAMAFVIAVIVDNFKVSWWILALVLLAGVVFFLVGRKTIKKFSLFEERFMANLNVKEEYARRQSPVATSLKDKLSKYDVHTEIVQIPADSLFAGKQLKQLPFRDTTGINIVKILRGDNALLIPSGNEYIYPYDKVLAVGTTEQLAAFVEMVKATDNRMEKTRRVDFSVEAITLTEDSYLTGKTLREADMRSYGCMVISIVRKDDIITNPKADFRFQPEDIVWLAGEKSACEWWN